MTATSDDASQLDRFVVRQSNDPVKADPELTCDACGEHLCDVEPGDTLSVLVLTAHGHDCTAP